MTRTQLRLTFNGRTVYTSTNPVIVALSKVIALGVILPVMLVMLVIMAALKVLFGVEKR